MHELALAEGILDIVRAQAAAQKFTRVKSIQLLVGGLSTVEPEALAFGFEVAARGTPAEGATLQFERPAGRAFCTACDREVPVSKRGDPCPECGAFRWVLMSGDELRVQSLEVD